MQDILIKILKDGLQGKNTHINPQKALENLTADIARESPLNGIHSCWDLLHHILVWQDGILEAIKGNKVDWKEISTRNWPTKEDLMNDSNFADLVIQFKQKTEETQKIIESVDFQKPIPAWENEPIIRALVVLLQHNSYHFGQIVAIRKHLNDWPTNLKF
jgi:uncharacterized damage-inducible protein DinB